jgi:adenylyltransferase/sulfurtransferase
MKRKRRTRRVPAAQPHELLDLSRYSRQILFEELGEEGQRRIRAARVAVVGCGALGSFHASILARAGVGSLRIIDRDFVEASNLQRQILFDEEDARRAFPKAAAAEKHLRRINSQVQCEGVVADLHHANADSLLADVDLILDGSDNFEVRLLLNDYSVARNLPWIYGACVGSYGLTFTILPGETPCLRCLFENAPPPGSAPSCDTAGVLASVVAVVSGLQTAEAMKILGGRRDRVSRQIQAVDVWEGSVQAIALGAGARRADCPACGRREFEFLSGSAASDTITLCGRNSVQLRPGGVSRVDLAEMERRLGRLGKVERNRYLVRARVESYEIALFEDGRAIISGTTDPRVARNLYARYVGH